MIEQLKQIDIAFFLAINNGLKSDILDLICPFMRHQQNWYLLYAFVLFVCVKKWKKQSIWVIGGLLVLLVISDQLSANLIKNAVERLRPCNEPTLMNKVYNIVGCGKGFSFVSAHAANHFAIAIYFSLLFGHQYKWVWYVSIFWALFIAFSQVYVGVHYPFDVICGAFIGSILGFVQGKLITLKLDNTQQ